MKLILPLASGQEAVNALPVPPVWYGIITFVVLVFLLLVTFAFRSVNTRH